ncbi:DNA-binding protein [Enemella dayhoffiae]|uniref:DNA-binding protein n=1 Tax=Enemella dayhoffiae TaxID=2016507 RepID=A0A255HDY1_9ACTN|nr:hypothetical protein [Enemella dayhoffiae]OYO25283.1 DNA-binding protein [Enemella dayhoffiae]
MQRGEAEVSQTRARQIELYGEPLQDVLGRCSRSLHLTQARMSELLGISAPMLSQLINGHRIKIGNPAAAQRLQWMIRIAQQVDQGVTALPAALEELHRNAKASDVLNAPPSGTARRTRHLATEIQEVCRQTAAATDFVGAAELVRERYPEIAEFLLIYGAERADRAMRHTDQVLRG